MSMVSNERTSERNERNDEKDTNLSGLTRYLRKVVGSLGDHKG